MPEFKHSMGISAIEQLKQENLFTGKLRPDIEKGEVFFAIRPGHGSFYVKGRRLFNYEKNNGFSTHIKFAVVPKSKKTYVTEDDLLAIANKGEVETSFQKAYEKIKKQAMLYADTEAEGVSKLYKFAPKTSNANERYFLVDIEVVFDAAQDHVNQDDDIVKMHSDRIDILLYDNQDQRLLFCEAKHFSNPEIWAPQGSPKVIDQLESYDKQIAVKKDEILDAYKTAFKEYNLLMDTDLKEPKSLCPKCGLLIFGFDSWQLEKINTVLIGNGILNGYKYKTIGNPNNIKIYDLFKTLSLQNQ